LKKPEIVPLVADTFDGKIHIEWDSQAQVTPLGQLPFFIQYLKVGHLFEPWVDDCPLSYASNNAPKKINVLGSFLLSILVGHTRYAHLTSLMGDTVNARLLGMTKVISATVPDAPCKKSMRLMAFVGCRTTYIAAIVLYSVNPGYIDADVTVKPLYGKQEEGGRGRYNPKKPGRPSHTYHTYMIANLRLILDVEVQAGNQSASCYSAPGL